MEKLPKIEPKTRPSAQGGSAVKPRSRRSKMRCENKEKTSTVGVKIIELKIGLCFLQANSSISSLKIL